MSAIPFRSTGLDPKGLPLAAMASVGPGIEHGPEDHVPAGGTQDHDHAHGHAHDHAHPHHGRDAAGAPSAGSAQADVLTAGPARIAPSPIWWGLPARLLVAAALAVLLWTVIVWALA